MTQETRNWTPAEVIIEICLMESVFPNGLLYQLLENDGFYPQEILLNILHCLEAYWETNEVDHQLQQPGLNRLANTLIGFHPEAS